MQGINVMGPYCESGSGSIFSHPHDAQVVCQPPRSPTCPERPARSARSLSQVPIPCACGLCSILLSPSMGQGEWLSLGSRISIASEGDPQCDSDPQADGKQNTVYGSTLQPVPVSMYKLCLVLKFSPGFVSLVPYLEGFQLGGQQKQLLHHTVALKSRLDLLGFGFCSGQCLCPQEAPPCRP